MSTARPRPVFALISPSLALASCALPSAQVASVETNPTISELEPGRSSGRAGRQPPRVIDAELVEAGDRLQLRFSEPITSVEGVDPNDFRLSVAMAYAYRTYAYAYYYDLGELFGDDDGELMTITAMTGAGDTLELSLDPPIQLEYCVEMQQEMLEAQSEPGVKMAGGLYLHYAPGQTAITDAQGDELRPAAAEWVLRRRAGGDEAYEMYFEGPKARRALREAIPIGCGSPPPPGPDSVAANDGTSG